MKLLLRGFIEINRDLDSEAVFLPKTFLRKLEILVRGNE